MSRLHDVKLSNFKFHDLAKQAVQKEPSQEDDVKVSGTERKRGRGRP